MADQTQVLRILVTHGDPMGLAEIGRKIIPLGGDRAALRRRIIAALGKLSQRKFAKRTNPKMTLQNKGVALYTATKTGCAFIRAGKTIECGTNVGKWTAPPRVLPDTVRQRIWEALRRARAAGQKITLPDIAEMVTRDGDEPVKVIDNARKYLKALQRAGIVVQMAQRAEGYAPSSNGFARFVLTRDCGALAFVTGKAGVFDPNTRNTIAYSEEQKA